MRDIQKDNDWNSLYWLQWKNCKKYYLQVKNEQYPRSLWQVHEWLWKARRDPDKHTHNLSQSYWFNWLLLSSLKDDCIIEITQVNHAVKLKTTVWEVKTAWFFLHFLSKWLEKQIFLKKSQFEEVHKKSKKGWKVKSDDDEMF